VFVILATCRRNRAVTGFRGFRLTYFLHTASLAFTFDNDGNDDGGCFQLRRANLPLFYSPRPFFHSSRRPVLIPSHSAAHDVTRLWSVNRPTQLLPNRRIADVIL